jgi:hypothetical protein
VRKLFAATAVVLIRVAACGGGDGSGWSKEDRAKVLEDSFGDPYPKCELRSAPQRFDSYDDYVRAGAGGRSEDATEAGKAYLNEVEEECF